MSNHHQSLAATTMLAPLPVVLVSAACSKARLRAERARDEEAFAQKYKESLGHFYDELDDGNEQDIIRTISTIAWTGVVSSTPPRLSVCIRPSRLLYALAKISERMTVYPICETFLKEADFCGVKSGREVDKFEACHFETYALHEDPEQPVYTEAPLVLPLKIEQEIDLDSHQMFIASIEDVLLHNSLLDEKGKVHLEKAKLVAFAHGEYYGIGSVLGFFGYSVASPEVLKRRLPNKR